MRKDGSDAKSFRRTQKERRGCMEQKVLWKTVGAAAVTLAALLACGLFADREAVRTPETSGATQTQNVQESTAAKGPLTRADISYQKVTAPAPSSSDGTLTASDWAATYPYIVASMGDNAKNSYITDYLEQDPYLVNIYEGYGFAKDYGSARGHEYTLEDVAATQRPHPKANCLTCKSPNFAKLVNEEGVGVYSRPFDEVMALMEDNISCYTCHGNGPGNRGSLTVTHSYVLKALGDSVSEIDPAVLACGQCHIEYYFTPSDSETMMPYSDRATMTPEAILDYYNAMGFYDWIQESTGAKMIKAQHPETETFLHGKHADLLTCSDCHMPIETADDGTVYHSHTLVSPLDNETLLATCAVCHGQTDMVSFVHGLQDRVTARETEVGNRLSGLKDALAAAVQEGKMKESELEAVRQLYREAQWFFDFCYVENAEGAHNSELAFRCLDTSDAKITEALSLLGA